MFSLNLKYIDSKSTEKIIALKKNHKNMIVFLREKNIFGRQAAFFRMFKKLGRGGGRGGGAGCGRGGGGVKAGLCYRYVRQKCPLLPMM